MPFRQRLAESLAEQLRRGVGRAVAHLALDDIASAGQGRQIGRDEERLVAVLVAAHHVVAAGVDDAANAGLHGGVKDVDGRVDVGGDQVRPGLLRRRIGGEVEHRFHAAEVFDPAPGWLRSAATIAGSPPGSRSSNRSGRRPSRQRRSLPPRLPAAPVISTPPPVMIAPVPIRGGEESPRRARRAPAFMDRHPAERSLLHRCRHCMQCMHCRPFWLSATMQRCNQARAATQHPPSFTASQITVPSRTTAPLGMTMTPSRMT